MSQKTLSPVTGNPAKKVGAISAESIVRKYQEQYDVDVSRYFEGLDEAAIYLCPDTGLRFFGPEKLAGEGDLYAQLQSFDWFYKSDKWEYTQAAKLVHPGDRLLDIGSGIGNFLKRVKQKGGLGTGLELNQKAAAQAQREGLDVKSELIEFHAEHLDAAYDIVSSFQVLEHVTNVKSFLTHAIKALKPGGLLILGVPNNKGFLGLTDSAALNMPPHHMGLWDADSLSSLSALFDIDIVSVDFEPLAEHAWFQAVIEDKYLPRGWKRSIYYRLRGDRVMARAIKECAHFVHGHTVLATFRKRLPT